MSIHSDQVRDHYPPPFAPPLPSPLKPPIYYPPIIPPTKVDIFNYSGGVGGGDPAVVRWCFGGR